jgi:RHS repeat-associated protein
VGPVVDAETGFQYLRARYYDPATGQFLTRDPIEAVTRSAYGYVNGNPLNLTDPLGLAPWDWAGNAVRSTRAFLSEHTEAMHFVINVGVGIAAGTAAAAICAGTAGLGCLIFAGAAAGIAIGTVAHTAGALAACCEEITVGKSLGWVASSAWAGGTGGVFRGAWGRGLGTGGPLRPKAGTPGLQDLAKQPFWSDPVKPTYGGWHGGFGW